MITETTPEMYQFSFLMAYSPITQK